MVLVPHRHVWPCWSSPRVTPVERRASNPAIWSCSVQGCVFLLFPLWCFLTSARRAQGCWSWRFELISFYCSRDRRMSSGSCSGTSDNLPHYPGVLGGIRQSNIGPHPWLLTCSDLVVCAFCYSCVFFPSLHRLFQMCKGSRTLPRLIPMRRYQISLRLFVMALVVSVSVSKRWNSWLVQTRQFWYKHLHIVDPHDSSADTAEENFSCMSRKWSDTEKSFTMDRFLPAGEGLKLSSHAETRRRKIPGALEVRTLELAEAKRSGSISSEETFG